MPIANVKKLWTRIHQDDAFRDRLDKAKDQAERETILKEEDLWFNDWEFSEGINGLRVKCQTEEDAEGLNQFRFWWEFLRRS